MKQTTLPQMYEARILPALNLVQERIGYLSHEAMEKIARELDVKLYQVNAVASCFPHFTLTPPPPVTLEVCRDMACHMAGAHQLLKELAPLNGEKVAIKGVSCLGRCDRAGVSCLSTAPNPKKAEAEHGHEGHYLFQKSSAQLKQIIKTVLETGKLPNAEHSASAEPGPTGWKIDLYDGEPSDYTGVRNAVKLRRESLNAQAKKLQEESGWTRGRADRFVTAAESRMIVDFQIDREMYDAVVAWQTTDNWADTILNEMDAAKGHADLRGMGGAGIPATQKWRDVREAVRTARKREAEDRAFIVVNGDESEPGTFKDRELLLRTPHLIVEGVILAGIITEATQGFIYIRHEYPEQVAACQEAIRQAEQKGLCGPAARELGRPFPLSVFVSPGGYICGEQSALIEALNDRRAEPRNLPPKLETNGLEDMPTLVSNVETFAWVPFIWVKGGQSYADLGQNGWRGKRFFSISGDVVRPGVYEAPMGMPLRELIHGQDYCQGIAEGRKLKAFAPSGPSAGFLPAKLTAAAGLPRKHTEKEDWKKLAERRGFDVNATELDILDLELELNLFRAISPTQGLGGGLVVYHDGRNIFDQAVNSVEFFRNESCGKCVPCRIGSQKMAAIGDLLRHRKISAPRWNSEIVPLIKDLGEAMTMSSICALGRSVPVPLQTAIQFFPEDLLAYTTAAAPAGVPSSKGVASVPQEARP